MPTDDTQPSITLIKAVKNLNIGMSTIVEFLAGKGYKVQKQPMAHLSQEMYNLLQNEFSKTNSIPGIKVVGRIDLREGPVIAKEIIDKCISEKLVELDLGGCRLTSQDFNQGSILDKALRDCTHIETLILSNEWRQPETGSSVRLKKSSKNRQGANHLKSIPKAVEVLTILRSLICCGQPDKEWSIGNIEALIPLKRLNYLDCSYNLIEDIQPLKQISHLNTIFLDHNKIKNLAPILKKRNLKHLDAGNNQITSVKGISRCADLEIVNLQNNLLVQLDDLGLNKYIRELYLNNNRLASLTPLEPLMTAKEDLYIEIQENPIIRDLQLILNENENHLPFIKEYFQRAKDESAKTEITYPVKILLLGNHAAGKSTLANFITGSNESSSTHILRIIPFNFAGEQNTPLPEGIFFDFGGQDFYHGVYRAFLSVGALHIVIFNPEKDKNYEDLDANNFPIINYNRAYWFGQKQYQEAGSQEIAPFIVIQNFADKDVVPSLIDYAQYPGFKRLFTLSLSPENAENHDIIEYLNFGKLSFKYYFKSIVSSIAQSSSQPLWYVDFLKYVLESAEQTHVPISFNTILKYYFPPNLNEEEKRESLRINLVTLHRHGLILYYPIATLENFVWLSPQKLVEHIQTEIFKGHKKENELIHQKGVVPRKNFEKQFSDKKILDLLKIQKVVFLHNPSDHVDHDEYIIPNYLPLASADGINLQLFAFGMERPNFTVKFDHFIPFGFINQLICFYGKQPDVKKFWRDQMLFTLCHFSKVLITLDFSALSIRVYIDYRKNELFSLSYINSYLFYSMLSLYWDFKGEQILSFEEYLAYKSGESLISEQVIQKIKNWETIRELPRYVPEDAYLSVDSENYIKYADLIALDESDFLIPAYKTTEDDKINLIGAKQQPASLFKDFTYKSIYDMKKVFVSYSKFDEDYLQDFEDHLVTLKHEGVATFNCRKIEFGEEWDAVIKKEIDECDIMVCLVSVKFLNTDYITKIEIPKAIDQGKMIIPIIIKACDWENSAIGKFQAAQRGKIVSMNNADRLNNLIKSNSREERDAFWTDIIKELRAKIFNK